MRQLLPLAALIVLGLGIQTAFVIRSDRAFIQRALSSAPSCQCSGRGMKCGCDRPAGKPVAKKDCNHGKR